MVIEVQIRLFGWTAGMYVVITTRRSKKRQHKRNGQIQYLDGKHTKLTLLVGLTTGSRDAAREVAKEGRVGADAFGVNLLTSSQVCWHTVSGTARDAGD